MVSLVWGFCEATFFFLVPDIWLSRIVLKDKKEAYINIAFTTLGALLGGSVLYVLAMSSFAELQKFLDFIPAISSIMIEKTGSQIQTHGIWDALLTGIMTGTPYKIYASWSGHLGASFITFLLASIIIRTLRFTAVTALAHAASMIFRKRLSLHQLYMIHAMCWLVFYIFYFHKFGF